MTCNYREGYRMSTVNGSLFNHESPRHGETFMTRMIGRAVVRTAAGDQDVIFMANLDAVRDWGYAPEYVEAMWRMLQHDEPTDYVVATGTRYEVKDFLQIAFDHLGMDSGKCVRFDERCLRPTEVGALVGDASKAKDLVGWEAKTTTPALARLMVDADAKALAASGKPWIDREPTP